MNKRYLNSGRTNQKLETRNKILASAQYYLNKGLEFNLEDIAKKTGISRATIYRYFSNIDILAAEAGLDFSTESPENLFNNLKGNEIHDKILEIQDYYNKLALDHENLFRKYISVVLGSNTSTIKRGARRTMTLKMALEETNFTQKEKENLSNLFTILMGIEPLIVTKDVCNLNNKDSIELMKWGINLIFKGLEASKE
ncbi:MULTISPECIES: TetR/AcrR family transcriptional regulator [Maribacter]|uniref:TetR/AcrR family transcriptional regulator n=1 Tax=Maribacter flavus TaxID=1658664 RepID=A0A5B2TXA7_9FLAO|nr:MULTISPECIES: TetR/AcrR family transcriptional regulator [Maribacter]KAA2218972.1 TetR/AcrR family transcriptional regulator [Maribacter flavus]MDC6403926.1 TetR/AcrR family transcriptional regulator [Maribacter sp. PR66]MEE1971067.1 TetR/AcrR family transcriptional regulator [Maribacter flavus]